jgi:hypothetical protein
MHDETTHGILRPLEGRVSVVLAQALGGLELSAVSVASEDSLGHKVCWAFQPNLRAIF